MPVTLRPLTASDEACFDAWLEAEAAERLGLPAGPATRPLVELQRVARRRDLERRGADPFVIEHVGRAVGYLVLSHDIGTLVLVDLYVAPDARGRGLGRATIEAALASHAAGATRARLSVERAHPIADLYRRMGFVEVDATPTHRRMFLSLPPTDSSTPAHGASHV